MILAVLSLLLFLSFGNISPRTLAGENPTVNEFFAHPSTGNKEWVEFYNLDNIDLSAYYLDDDLDFVNDSGSSSKKSLSSIDNSSTSPYPTFEFDSFLNNSGDFVVLFDPNGTIIDQYQYIDDPGENVSVGRSPDGTGAYNILSMATKGLPNSNPQPSPSPSPIPTINPSPASTISSTKSPSPSPKIGGVTSTKSPAPTSNISNVLGASTKDVVLTYQGQSPSPSPSPQPKEQGLSKIKIAGVLVGSGVMIIVSSVAFFLWYKRILTKDKPDSDDGQHPIKEEAQSFPSEV